VLSQGNDTLSLWRTGDGRSAGAPGAANASPNGRYYHARLRVRGSVDFICPRGWCYMVDSEIFEVNPAASAAIWHDGSRDSDMKFVLRRCRFDGVEGWTLARWHHDAQFFLIDCTFSPRMRDRAPYRVIYPLNAGPATDADRARNRELDATNRWGTRAYFHQSRRADGDYPWHADNLERSAQAPKPADITARWTFGGKWDPENANGPTIKSVAVGGERVAVTFSEGVTVKGRPRLRLREGGAADYTSGSGTDTLVFTASTPAPAVAGLDFNGGAILASEAAATLRLASPVLP
jgi:pectinesterase